MSGSHNSEHSRLVNEILARFGARPDCRLRKQHVGRFRTFDGRWVDIGIDGMADITGCLIPSGRSVQIEVKTGSGVRTKKQLIWAEQSIARGEAYLLARSVDDVQAWLDGLARGL